MLELIIVTLAALAGMAVGFWLAVVILSIVTSIVHVPELWLLAYIWLAGMLLLGGAAGAALGYWIAGRLRGRGGDRSPAGSARVAHRTEETEE
jgi:hypothetical protein